ncbi:glycosyltransferase family 4 protein [Pleomassaria siparia CBS 279.74]|uniref:GDP-Man:Man(3)GlcNAc(2)-PP-Dol alpha-1,2-mannosyltransferase n=1 Tax=Pleomassaria siparia CBS 279.74 TaxID=1314801 RepID=A0A6G1JXD6_9PLEO|nr:glycosyltransferase family 4 protein [Pleomassaria siparia CBS 279.74]
MGFFPIFISLLAAVTIAFAFAAQTLRVLGLPFAFQRRRTSREKRILLLDRTAKEQERYEKAHNQDKDDEDDWQKIESSVVGSAANGTKADPDWHGFVGFLHPFCNAGGGGERVLWAAIRATQKRWPEAICVVYTGDNMDKDIILQRVKDRFNIHLHPPRVHFLYLTTRYYVLSTTYTRFTLLGQSLGSLIMAYDAFTLLVPDIFIDTMGYAFSLGLCSILFPEVPTAAYVHYPTISTDMINSLNPGGQGVNAGSGSGLRGMVKREYWTLFAKLYCRVGSTVDVIMTNSTWTQAHIKKLWSPYRNHRGQTTDHDIDIVFPPVAVEELEEAVQITEASEQKRGPYMLYIGQFRPEKNHPLILEAFSTFMKNRPSLPTWRNEKPRLVLIGSVRDSHDQRRVYKLRLLARELNVADSVEFVCDATWPQMLDWMRRASVGVNGMWNEHFGIGVVEYQAAGLISVVNNSGGPKLDIVVDIDGKPTGFHASTADEYAQGFLKALSLPPDETLAMRHRARKSSQRFTDGGFAEKWVENMNRLVQLQTSRANR